MPHPEFAPKYRVAERKGNMHGEWWCTCTRINYKKVQCAECTKHIVAVIVED